MKAPDLNASLAQESCLFEAPMGFSAEFSLLPKARIVFRTLSVEAIHPDGVTFHLVYLSPERNVLRESIVTGTFSIPIDVNPRAVAAVAFDITLATTVTCPLETIIGASSIIMTLRTTRPFFIRRDTMRLERIGTTDSSPPHSVLLAVSEVSQPRYLAQAKPGRHVFTSRSCIGAKGVIFKMTSMDSRGTATRGSISLIARLASLNVGAIAIPRARRLERPERFNKEIVIPDKTMFISGALSTIATVAECFYDIFAFKMTRYRTPVGLAIGIALFERLSLDLHETALSTSREEFLSLAQGD